MVDLIGTSYRLTRLAERERLAASGLPAPDLAARARAAVGASECVVLRTCNRVEVYLAGAEGGGADRAAEWLLAGGEEGYRLPPERCYHLEGGGAVAHLFSVTCGLDSMILGEQEIVGQVRLALADAQAAEAAGCMLLRLFQRALHTGKRARRETAISEGVFSIGQCAARLAERAIGRLEGRGVLIIGAGQAAKSLGKHVSALGAGPLTVLARTPERARSLADVLGGEAAGFADMAAALVRADVVAGCASAPHPVLHTAQVLAALASRGGRPLVVVDLGAPRNIEPTVAALPGVTLLNLEDVEAQMAGQAAARAAAVERVRAIVAEETDGFLRWLWRPRRRPRGSALFGRAACAATAGG